MRRRRLRPVPDRLTVGKDEKVKDGFYYYTFQEMRTFSLSVLGEKRLLEYSYKRDLELLARNFEGDTYEIQEAATKAGTHEISVDQLQEMVNQSGLKYDIQEDIDYIKVHQ